MEKGKRSAQTTRGEATLFGFKRPAHAAEPAAAAKGRQPPSTPPPPPLANANDTTTITKETIEPLVIAPVQLRQGTPKLGRSKKNASGKAANRFGFRPAAPLSNKVADLQETRSETELRERPHSTPPVKLSSVHSSDSRLNKKCSDGGVEAPGKLTLQCSNLPRPQSAVKTSPIDKWAKTAANTQTVTRSQLSSLAGIHADKSCESPIQIQRLDHSPSLNKPRHNQQKPRQFEMVLSSGGGGGGGGKGRAKTFELRESRASSASPLVGRGGSRGGAAPAARCPPPPFQPRSTSLVRERRERYEAALAREENRRTIAFSSPSMGGRGGSGGFSSDEEEEEDDDDEEEEELTSGCFDTTEEEKLSRDKVASEKDPSLRGAEGGSVCGSPNEEMWGHGEAMAVEDDLGVNLEALDKSPETMNPPLRTVLLTIEDPTFATLAAMSNSGMLEDEVSPETLDLSCSPPPSVEPLPPPPNMAKDDSPDSPGTPTHASNSLSSDTRDRDFLIDDEIADQPGLVFNGTTKANQHSTANESSLLDSPKTIANLAGQVSRVLATISSSQQSSGKGGGGGGARETSSTGTLSPCESIASDDLMVDYDRSDASNFDEYGLNDLDETALKSELENQSGLVMKEWNSILSSHPGLSQTMRGSRSLLRTRLNSSGSNGAESPRSRSNVSSPLRAPRVGASSPGDDISDDSGIRVDRGTYQHMFQDVINIKTMLLRLKRVLQESDTINPFDHNLKNGLYIGLASSEAGEETSPQLADLRRQVVFLQHQMEEKDRTILHLQEALARSNEARPQEARAEEGSSKVNAATQTDRIRPLSTGPTLLQTSPDSSCPLVRNSSECPSEEEPCSPAPGGQTLPRSRVPVAGPRRSLSNAPTGRQEPSRSLAPMKTDSK